MTLSKAIKVGCPAVINDKFWWCRGKTVEWVPPVKAHCHLQAVDVSDESASLFDLRLASFCRLSHFTHRMRSSSKEGCTFSFSLSSHLINADLYSQSCSEPDDKWLAIILFRLLPGEICLSGLMSYMTWGKLKRRRLPAYVLVSTLGYPTSGDWY